MKPGRFSCPTGLAGSLHGMPKRRPKQSSPANGGRPEGVCDFVVTEHLVSVPKKEIDAAHERARQRAIDS